MEIEFGIVRGQVEPFISAVTGLEQTEANTADVPNKKETNENSRKEN